MALKHLTLTMFYIVAFTAPMIVAILAATFLKENLSPGKALAVLAGFIGVLIAVYGPGDTSQKNDLDRLYRNM